MASALKKPHLDKSCLKKFEQGEILFEDEEKAYSLFIIQSGQIRLFKSKGEGCIEIALLRAGEVMGEMAFFDDVSNLRSCSAQALVPSEVIEISFDALNKTIKGLNPWFRVVFNTMAERLRRSNFRVRSLESNNVSAHLGSSGGKGYKFFTSNDIIRSLSILFLVIKAHGKDEDKGVSVPVNTLNFYAQDIFNIAEVKFFEFCQLLESHKLCSIRGDFTEISIQNFESLRKLVVFFNTQKATSDEKRIKISDHCEFFLDHIKKAIDGLGSEDDEVNLPLNDLLDEIKSKKKRVEIDDLEDARRCHLVGDVIVGESGSLSIFVNNKKLKESFTAIKLMNTIHRFNLEQKKKTRF